MHEWSVRQLHSLCVRHSLPKLREPSQRLRQWRMRRGRYRATDVPLGGLSGEIMERFRFTLSFLALVLVASLALSCGSGSGQLQSITLSPANAEGQAQFVATGYYINPSHTVTPQSANWVACQQNAPTADVLVTNTGVAQCASGAAGAYSIKAWDIPKSVGISPCPVQTACSGGCAVWATAQLTCP
jgi:hypothetical protein